MLVLDVLTVFGVHPLGFRARLLCDCSQRVVIAAEDPSEGFCVHEQFGSSRSFVGTQQKERHTHREMNNQKILQLAKGFRGRSKNCIRTARERVEKALQYAYRDRRVKKRDMRGLWIQRINAGTRQHGVSDRNRASSLFCAFFRVSCLAFGMHISA
jgi:ribosomal protein L20